MTNEDYTNYWKQRLEKIKYMREEQGKTCREIADFFEVSTQNISQLCRKYGFKRNLRFVRQVQA